MGFGVLRPSEEEVTVSLFNPKFLVLVTKSTLLWKCYLLNYKKCD